MLVWLLELLTLTELTNLGVKNEKLKISIAQQSVSLQSPKRQLSQRWKHCTASEVSLCVEIYGHGEHRVRPWLIVVVALIT